MSETSPLLPLKMNWYENFISREEIKQKIADLENKKIKLGSDYSNLYKKLNDKLMTYKLDLNNDKTRIYSEYLSNNKCDYDTTFTISKDDFNKFLNKVISNSQILELEMKNNNFHIKKYDIVERYKNYNYEHVFSNKNQKYKILEIFKELEKYDNFLDNDAFIPNFMFYNKKYKKYENAIPINYNNYYERKRKEEESAFGITMCCIACCTLILNIIVFCSLDYNPSAIMTGIIMFGIFFGVSCCCISMCYSTSWLEHFSLIMKFIEKKKKIKKYINILGYESINKLIDLENNLKKLNTDIINLESDLKNRL
ncbi:hypothetical protein Hokovirus_1_341 [Hokovirus HKV1]|uniref:Uncharacterized protein n=1 Tax=Hokovirus HKV1 TaxID=1977638 RepID=A0A1V0SFH5_9VIRU|nr:hypothetical protein Hokovirus_1_341 [Hokovirus HKV1]